MISPDRWNSRMDSGRQISDEDFVWVCEGIVDSDRKDLSPSREDGYLRGADSV